MGVAVQILVVGLLEAVLNVWGDHACIMGQFIDQGRYPLAVAQIQQVLPEDEARKFTKGEALQGLVSRIITDEITSRTLELLRLLAKGEEINRGDGESDETEDNSENTEMNGKQKEEKTKKPNKIEEDNEVDKQD